MISTIFVARKRDVSRQTIEDQEAFDGQETQFRRATTGIP